MSTGIQPKFIHGLLEFLEALSLEAYASDVQAWAARMGAAFLEEIVENIEALASDLDLKPLERTRLLRKGLAAGQECLRRASASRGTSPRASTLSRKAAKEWQPSEWCMGRWSRWKEARRGFQQLAKTCRSVDSHESSLEDIGWANLDASTVPNVNNVGGGIPLYIHFDYEDWVLFDLRVEMHLLLHDTCGIRLNEAAACYKAYFRKPLPVQKCNVGDARELLKIVSDTLRCSENDVVVPTLSKDVSLDQFVRLGEAHRRRRISYVEAGDEAMALHFRRSPRRPPSVASPPRRSNRGNHLKSPASASDGRPSEGHPADRAEPPEEKRQRVSHGQIRHRPSHHGRSPSLPRRNGRGGCQRIYPLIAQWRHHSHRRDEGATARSPQGRSPLQRRSRGGGCAKSRLAADHGKCIAERRQRSGLYNSRSGASFRSTEGRAKPRQHARVHDNKCADGDSHGGGGGSGHGGTSNTSISMGPSRLAPTVQAASPALPQNTSAASAAQSLRDDQSEPLEGLGMPPSGRQVLRSEVLGRVAVKDLFKDVADRDFDTRPNQKEDALKSRIRKMLELAFHPNTSEAESGQALRNAQKLMRSHNLQEADIAREVAAQDEGGLQAVKMTPVHGQRMRRDHECWVKSLTVAVESTFDVASFVKRDGQINADHIIFYGHRAASDLAAYAFTCAANRIEWKAGMRALPPNEVFAPCKDHSHAGKRFSEVLHQDPGYVDFVKYLERQKGEGGANDQLRKFIEYIRAQEDPTEWDRAYKEGMASALRKRALTRQKLDQTMSDALALSSRTAQKSVLERMGVNLKKGKSIRGVDGFRQARQRGSLDASAVDLRQRQVEHEECLALPAPKQART